ncbi:MAG: hypothetical protein ABR562_00310 [Thermoplasmatota archaeon]|nr:DUF1616 domain-containing protein [Halobacteriales archaeon]
MAEWLWRKRAQTERMRRKASWDLLALTLGAMSVYVALPHLQGGSLLRIGLAAFVLWVPGYLLLQTVEPVTRSRWRHAAVAVGVGPALVGLAALATAIRPGGFRPGNIAVAEASLVLLLGAAAWMRRRPLPAPSLPLVPPRPTLMVLLPIVADPGKPPASSVVTPSAVVDASSPWQELPIEGAPDEGLKAAESPINCMPAPRTRPAAKRRHRIQPERYPNLAAHGQVEHAQHVARAMSMGLTRKQAEAHARADEDEGARDDRPALGGVGPRRRRP